MSDALRYATLGIAALAGKSQQVKGRLSEIEAARRASEQEFAQQVRLEQVKSGLQLERELSLKDREFLIEQRKGNVRNHLIGLPDGSIDVIRSFGPRDDSSLFPEGSVQLGFAMGLNPGTSSNPFEKASDYMPDIPEHLFTYRGVPDTRAGHIKNYGIGVDLYLGAAVGTRTRKNGDHIYTADERRGIYGSRFNRTFEIQSESGLTSTTNASEANKIRKETGNPIVVIDQEVDNNGAAIGEPKREVYKGQVTLPDRTRTEESYDVYVPTKTGVEVVSGLTEAEYLQTLKKYKITDPRSVYTEVNQVKRDAYTNEVISQSQSRTIIPKDVEVNKTTYDIVLPNGQTITSVDAEDVDRHLLARNLSRSDVTLHAFDTTYLNGEIKSHTVNKELSSSRTAVTAFGYVTGKDGEPLLVTGGQSESEWNEQYGKINGASFGGIRKMVDGRIAEEVASEDVDTVLLTGRDAEGNAFEVLADQATEDQRQRATSSVKVKVSPSGRVTRTDAPAATDRQKLVEKQNVPFTISGDLMDGSRLLGAPSDLKPEIQLVRMNSTLMESGVLASLIESKRDVDYVNVFAPLIYNTVDQMRKDQLASDGTDLLGGKTIAHFVSDLYPGFKQVPGLIQRLRDTDTINFGQAAAISNGAATQQALPGELTITAQSSTGDTMDADNRNPDPSSTGNQTVALSCNVPAANAQFCQNVLIPKLTDIHGPGNPTNIKIVDMMEKQFDPAGNPIVDGNGVVKLAQAQPIMSVFGEFSRNVVDASTNETYFDKFVDAANGATMLDSDYRYLTKAVSAAPSLNSAVLHIAPLIRGVNRNSFNEVTFIPPSLQDVARRNGIGRFSTTQSEQQYFATIAKQESALKVKKYSGALINTLVQGEAPDGSRIYRASTGLGELDLTVEGLFYLKDEGVSRIKSLLSGGNFEEVGKLVKGNLAAYKDRILEEQRILSPADAKRIEDNAAGQNEINQIIDDIISDAQQAEDETSRLLAIRQLYIVSLAYELSATMQGGTGGRTISDQDVAIILKALRTKFTASPQQQVAVLEEIGNIADDIYHHTRYRTMRASDPEKMAEVAAYYFASGMSAVYGDPRGFHRDIDVYAVRDRIVGAGALGRIPDDEVLESINLQRQFDNLEPYASYSDIPEEEANAARAAFSGV